MPEPTLQPRNYVSSECLKRKMVSMHPVIPETVKRHESPISMGLGEPFRGFQPITSLQIGLANRKVVNVPRVHLSGDGKKKISIEESLRYGDMNGLKGLWDNIRDFTMQVGNCPAFANWEIHPTFGRNNGFHRICETFLNKDDVILVEEFTSDEFITQIKNVGAVAIPIKIDFETGIDYSYLENLVENWGTIHPHLKNPKLLYTMPSGMDPTGASQSLSLKRKIYNLCNEFDLLIIEDDPYGFISLADFANKKDYLRNLSPSYQTLDEIGRVIRIDTFSKTFAPGLKLGYIIATKEFVGFLEPYSEIINDFPPGPSQVLVNSTIIGMGGWINWLMVLSDKYAIRKKIVNAALKEKKHLKITDSKFGMFVGLQLQSMELSKFLSKCIANGVELDSFNSLIEGKSIVRISLCAGDDEQFAKAVEKLSMIV